MTFMKCSTRLLLTIVVMIMLTGAIILLAMRRQGFSARVVTHGTPKAANTTSGRAVAPEQPALAQSSSSLPPATSSIIEQPGHTLESNDLVIAANNHRELKLSTEELQKLELVYVDAVRKRTTYEASIAKVESVSPNERTITIPKYPEQGALIEADLYAKIAAAIGNARAEKLQQVLRSELYVRNFGFGDAEQKLVVRLSTAVPNGIVYEIEHSVSPLHVSVRDGSGAVQLADVETKTARSVLPISNLSYYTAFVGLFPVGP